MLKQRTLRRRGKPAKTGAISTAWGGLQCEACQSLLVQPQIVRCSQIICIWVCRPSDRLGVAEAIHFRRRAWHLLSLLQVHTATCNFTTRFFFCPARPNLDDCLSSSLPAPLCAPGALQVAHQVCTCSYCPRLSAHLSTIVGSASTPVSLGQFSRAPPARPASSSNPRKPAPFAPPVHAHIRQSPCCSRGARSASSFLPRASLVRRLHRRRGHQRLLLAIARRSCEWTTLVNRTGTMVPPACRPTSPLSTYLCSAPIPASQPCQAGQRSRAKWWDCTAHPYQSQEPTRAGTTPHTSSDRAGYHRSNGQRRRHQPELATWGRGASWV